MVTSASSYELNPHESGQEIRRNRRHTQSDFVFALLCCSLLATGSYLLVTETPLLDPLLNSFDLDDSILQPLFTRTLMYAILTLDSFRNPDRDVNVNFFPVQGRYVPLFHLGLDFLMGYRLVETIHGILVGTIYLILITDDSHLASILGRRRVIFKPQWILHLIGEEREDDSQQENEEDNPNVLSNAAAMNDLSVLLHRLRQLDSVPPANIAAATAPFRQKVCESSDICYIRPNNRFSIII
jgi:hypothetical protein